MRINKAELQNTGNKSARLIIDLYDADLPALGELVREVNNNPSKYSPLQKITHRKTLSQVEAIWGKIGEIADALYASREEIYEHLLRTYGQSDIMRIQADRLPSIKRLYRIVDVKERRLEDNTLFIVCYRGLSTYTTIEAERFLDGIQSELKEMGLPYEVRK